MRNGVLRRFAMCRRGHHWMDIKYCVLFCVNVGYAYTVHVWPIVDSGIAQPSYNQQAWVDGTECVLFIPRVKVSRVRRCALRAMLFVETSHMRFITFEYRKCLMFLLCRLVWKELNSTWFSSNVLNRTLKTMIIMLHRLASRWFTLAFCVVDGAHTTITSLQHLRQLWP